MHVGASSLGTHVGTCPVNDGLLREREAADEATALDAKVDGRPVAVEGELMSEAGESNGRETFEDARGCAEDLLTRIVLGWIARPAGDATAPGSALEACSREASEPFMATIAVGASVRPTVRADATTLGAVDR